MPSPVGHALGGLIAGGAVTLLASARVPAPTTSPNPLGVRFMRAALLLALLGALPDIDFLVGRHSRETHSLGAVLLVAFVAWLRFGAGWGTASSRNQADEGSTNVPQSAGAEGPAESSRAMGMAIVGVVDVSRAGWTLACAAAYASHILLDWLGSDTAPPIGIQALWPLSRQYFESPWHVFYAVDRRYWLPGFFTGAFRTVGWELMVLGPLAVAAWWRLCEPWRRVGRQAAR